VQVLQLIPLVKTITARKDQEKNFEDRIRIDLQTTLVSTLEEEINYVDGLFWVSQIGVALEQLNAETGMIWPSF